MATTTVRNTSELKAALSGANGGDEIRLAPGNYGNLTLNGTSFGGEVTVTSANTDDPANLSGLRLSNVKNLTLDSLLFDYDYSGQTNVNHSPFQVRSSEGVTIANSIFDGDTASNLNKESNGYGYGVGLTVNGSKDITVDGNLFQEFYTGARFSDTDDLVVANNEVHQIRSDGMKFGEIENVVLQNNYFHDFKGSPSSNDHRDMVQFFKVDPDTATRDVKIVDNVFDIGDGSWTHSLYMGDSGQTSKALYYQNVLIEGNEVYAAQHHGLSVGLANDVVIRNNLVVPVDANQSDPTNAGREGGGTYPKIGVVDKSTNVEIHDNIMFALAGHTGQSSWSVRDNTILRFNDNVEARLQAEYESSGVDWNGNAQTITLDATKGDEDDAPSDQPDEAGGTNSAEIGVGLTEAESLNLSGYEVRSNSDFSGGGVIKVISNSGTASGAFTGADGDYVIDVDWLNESDGASSFELLVNGARASSWSGSGGSDSIETESTAVSLSSGDEIELRGTKDVGEFARIDSMTVRKDDGSSETDSDPAPAPEPSPEPDLAEIGVGLTEAEALDLAGYEIRSNSDYSNDALIKVASDSGSASGIFSGDDGDYVINVDWLNEDDGASDFELLVNGALATSWSGNGGSNSIETESVSVSLSAGDEIELRGSKDVGEFARVDAIEIVESYMADELVFA